MSKKKKITLALVLAAALLLLATGAWMWLRARNAEEIDETLNLLVNPSFEEIDSEGWPKGWVEGKWYWDSGVSVLELSDDAYDGNHSVMIYNTAENDARFTQRVSVAPDSWYRISCYVKAEGCGPERKGAGISVESTRATSEYVYDTEGEWEQVTLYGRTGPKQTSMTVMARLGGYSSLNVGKAWFDGLEVVRLKSLPAGAAYESLDVVDSAPQAEGPSSSEGLIVMAALAFCVLMALGGWAMLRQKAGKGVSALVLALGGVAALAIRVFCAWHIRGYEVDMNCFEGWAARITQSGVLGFYNAGWCDYPPGYMLILYVLGSVRNLLGLTQDGPAVWLLFKSVPILCDFLIGLVIYWVGRKKLGYWPATVLALMYLINPATVLNSSAWGQVDSVLTLLLLLAVYSACRGKWVRSMAIYAVAVLMKPQALMFGPVGLLAIGCEVWGSQERKKVLAEAAKGIGVAALVMLAVLTPFAVGQGRDPFTWAAELYGGTLSSYPYITINACNLYALLGKNWVSLEDAGRWTYLAWAMYAVAFGYSFFLYIRSKKRSRLFLICAVMLALVFAFGAKMHERYLYPVIGLLLMAYVVTRDARLLLSMLLLSMGQFINGALVLENTHLQSNQAAINGVAAVMNIAGALVSAWIGWSVCVSGRTQTFQPKEDEAPKARRVLILREDAGLHLHRADYLVMAALTAVYSVVAFVNLGSIKAPQTSWTSTMVGESVVFDLGEEQTFHLTYYGGICDTSFTVALSSDGNQWGEERLAVYDQGQIFRWLWYVPSTRDGNGKFISLEAGDPMQTARYVRVTAERSGLVLHEVGFLNEEGQALPIRSITGYGGDGGRAQSPTLLIDEQDTIPPYPTYYNSSYFDEIYHARTGYEHLHGMRPYETSHPPLGKVMIMLGIRLFGMTPFGWRFMGTLLGCLMIPVMYLLTKQLLKRREYATLAAFLLTVDCMHFTQTRIATIDTYGVFFILLMYLFMFRYCQMNFYIDDFRRTLVPLALSGLFMGLGIASKWICIYAALGLAILLFYTLGRRVMEYRSARAREDGGPLEEKAKKSFVKYFWLTGLWCVLFFVVVPALIYYFSYYWYMKPMGGLSVERVWRTQESMFNYHKGITADGHSFASPWYEWPLIIKPMWYFSGTRYMPAGVVSSISCMGNPAVWWVGAAAMALLLTRLIIRRGSRNDLFVAIGFAAQYVPWMLVPRSMFIYHYFASVPFIILAIALGDQWLKEHSFRWRKPVMVTLCVAALALFIAFYPLMSGMPVARSYAMYLRWFNWYNF